MRVAVLLLLFALPAAAQDQSSAQRSLTTENPLATLKGQLMRVLADADVPFTPAQEDAIVLMMEERRQASEAMFGDLMNYSDGPRSGIDAERLQSAISWMRNEFLTRVKDYLVPEQLEAWNTAQAAAAAEAAATAEAAPATAAPRRAAAQTQYVRINNNRFTAEDANFGIGGGGQAANNNRTDVIPRGGAGAFHGNVQTLFKDDALNARNKFAANKPPYSEHAVTFDSSGPVIPGRMTVAFNTSHTRAEDVGTINATLPDREFSLGFSKPTITRTLGGGATYQLSDSNSLDAKIAYTGTDKKDQNVGGFTLHERGSDSHEGEWTLTMKQFSALSSGSLYETNLAVTGTSSETTPKSNATKIDVLDAFNGGGAQNRTDNDYRTYTFGNLYTRLGQKLTLKTGIQGNYRTRRSLDETNFGGYYVFSDIESYLAGRSVTYRETRGEPLLVTTEFDISPFIQYDWAVSRQFALMFGLRYDYQDSLDDRNNFAPRVGFTRGFGATVVRGGAGIFYENLPIDRLETQRRFDGTRQFEVIVDKAVYPDPFSTGTIRRIDPSIWRLDPAAISPLNYVTMVSVERTFWRNLLVTATYDHRNITRKLRVHDVNAPYDSTALPILRSCTSQVASDLCVRPDPTLGSVINIESTGFERSHYLRLSARQRFSIFNITANYTGESTFQEGRPWDFPSDNYDLTADNGRRPSPSHQFNSSINAALRGGVFLTGVIRADSTRYYTITTGRDDNRDGLVNDRLPIHRRNGAVGPKYFNLDFNVSKAIFLSGPGGSGTRKNLNVFANLTNALNRVHLNTPSGVMTSRNFGRITGATNPRQVQVGMRFQY